MLALDLYARPTQAPTDVGAIGEADPDSDIGEGNGLSLVRGVGAHTALETHLNHSSPCGTGALSGRCGAGSEEE